MTTRAKNWILRPYLVLAHWIEEESTILVTNTFCVLTIVISRLFFFLLRKWHFSSLCLLILKTHILKFVFFLKFSFILIHQNAYNSHVNEGRKLIRIPSEGCYVELFVGVLSVTLWYTKMLIILMSMKVEIPFIYCPMAVTWGFLLVCCQ